MTTIEVTETVHFPVERVWAAWADFGGIHRFHPLIKASPLLSECNTGLGAERECHFHDGNTVSERIVGFDVAERELTVEIFDGSMPLTEARAVIRLFDRGDETDVRFRMSYEPKFGAVGKLMDATMMRRRFRKILSNMIAGLNTHLATGAIVGRDGQPSAPVTAVAA
jgi:uncharacterized membrane protein